MNKENGNALTKSQEWIIDALLSLMKEKPFKKIKIVEISECADLDRRTFYRYFKSKEDVLELYCKVLLTELADRIMEVDKATENTLPKEHLSFKTVSYAYFQFWYEHLDFLELLQESKMLYFFYERYDSLMYHHVSLKVKKWLVNQELSKETRYHFFYHMGGALHMAIRWMMEADRDTPEAMANMISKLFE